MLNTSNEYKDVIQKNRSIYTECRIVFPDGYEMTLDSRKHEIYVDGFAAHDSTSNSGKFDIGATIINETTFKIYNGDERFSEKDFSGAVMKPRIGLQLSDKIEWLKKGVFTAEPGQYTGNMITVKALDNMHKFDRQYSESNLIYPATLGAIVRDACSCCGVSLAADSASFENDDYVVDSRPDDSSLTFRNVLLWVGQISCHWCKCNQDGELTIGWYDTGLLGRLISGFDGGTFAFEGTENTLDGGTMNPWSTGDYEVDGGAFKESGYHHIHSLASMNICTDDVVITGIKVVEKTDKDKDITSLYGTDGYVLSIEGNELIQNGKGADVAEYLGERLVGLQFRPLSVSCLSDPSMEAGDVAVVTDRKGNSYPTLITSTTFTSGNYQQVSCDAETPIRKSAQRFSEATRLYQELRGRLSRQKTEWEKAIENLGNSLGVTSGLYSTTREQEDGSNIYYLHDRVTLEESMVVWKMTSQAWGVSTDGGKTWNGGMTVDGDSIIRILTAIGINADWINAGSFTIKDEDGNIIFLADCDTRRVEIHPDIFTLSGKTIEQIANGEAYALFQDRENLLKDTVEFSSDYWTSRGAKTTAQEDPDGGTNAVRIARQRVGSLSFTGYLHTDSTNRPIRSTGQIYTFSIWLKASAETTAKLTIAGTSETVDVTTDWKRYTMTVQVDETVAESGQVQIDMVDTEDADGNVLYLYVYDPSVVYGAPGKEYTREEIMDIITNGGTSQDIVMIDGKIFIYAEYIKGLLVKAENIVAGAVTADKTDIKELAAIGATIAGLTMTDNTISGSTTEGNGGTMELTSGGGKNFLKFTDKVLGSTTYGIDGITGRSESCMRLLPRADLSSETVGDGTHHSLGATNFYGALEVHGPLTVSSGYTKSVARDTENYGTQLFYCYETPSPILGDIGSGQIGEDGTCVVSIDDIFQESTNTGIDYYVFLQKEGQGDLWVDSKEPAFFVVKGTPGLRFAWEVKAKQGGMEFIRFRDGAMDNNYGFSEPDYESILENDREELIKEMEALQ